LRGAQNRTLKPKDVNHLGPQVLEGIRMLEEGARKMRERAEGVSVIPLFAEPLRRPQKFEICTQ
jgi:hypothetical protein